ncbi:unnamed protein product [Trifolium pratense]|uniref:Uncharacterized protein n=1 Tax=Trifolium pratense TaxID=57577 RepID=A0ACB0J7M0_TRIPR|nr:unnamed protein product [Trifolium pratense]
MKLNKEMKNKRNKIIMCSFSLAKNLYATGRGKCSSKHSEFEIIAEFLESNTSLSVQQENRLKQMGATVRNGGLYVERLKKLNEEREKRANNVMEKMVVEQLSDLLSFYHNMGKICSQILETKLNA